MSSFGSDPSGNEWPMIVWFFFGIILGVVLGIPGFLGRTLAHIFKPRRESKQGRARFWLIVFGVTLACNPASSFIVDPMQSYSIHPQSSKLNEPIESLRLEVEAFDSETFSIYTIESDEAQERLDFPLIEPSTTIVERGTQSTPQESNEAQQRLDSPLIESSTRTSTEFNPPFQSEIECRFGPFDKYQETPSKRPLGAVTRRELSSISRMRHMIASTSLATIRLKP